MSPFSFAPPQNGSKNSNTLSTSTAMTMGPGSETLASDPKPSPMGPPPSVNPNPDPDPDPDPVPSDEPEPKGGRSAAAPYSIPAWSQPPEHPFFVEILKDGAIIDQLDVSVKGAYMFGRVDMCDFILEHPTVSRFHAVLQFRGSNEAFLYDLGSTHGTSINKNQVKKKVYVKVHVGDVIRFGQSSRLYIFQGPTEFMPPEADITKIRRAKIQEEIEDREASLLRAKVESSLANGISWGMAEDAPEEADENDADEVTWQTYKGQLTERQEKTRGKILKRMEKVANMRKEIDAIRAKDIAQGGLTQGQQTQIARNEQRMTQILEELDSLEETLNESIQESIGARVKRVTHSKKKGVVDEEEDELMSDEDEFYDRTKKKSTLKKSSGQQSVETAETLLDKRGAIISEIEEKESLLQKEKTKTISRTADVMGEDDALDAYMTGLSSEMILDATERIQKEIAALQTELDRTSYLLKIADPTGEAALKRNGSSQAKKSDQSSSLTADIVEQPPFKRKKATLLKPAAALDKTVQTKEASEEEKVAQKETESKTPSYTLKKPQWLGAVTDVQSITNRASEAIKDVQEADQSDDKFVDYKDRKKELAPSNKDHEIEDAAPGLILRKRKQTGEPGMTTSATEKDLTSTSGEVETSTADAMALLLKHKRGYFAGDDEMGDEVQKDQEMGQPQKSKRVLGPEKPAFLESNKDYEAWVPPAGQSGDGRTSLNDKFGY